MILELMQCTPAQILFINITLMIILIVSLLLDCYIEKREFKKFVRDYYNGTLRFERGRLL